MQSRDQLLMSSSASRAEAIAELNDQLRINGNGGQLMISEGVHSLVGANVSELLRALAAFDDFNEDCDPYGERDFGIFQFGGAELMWKIDYYGDAGHRFGSSDPANPDLTWRVLTILLVSEY